MPSVHRALALLSAVPLIILGGCSLESTTPRGATREALSNDIPPGQASIYVIRPVAGGCFTMDIDDHAWGALGDDAWVWDPVAPGHHVLRPAGGEPLAFDAEAGKTYYFEAGTSRIRPVTESEGRKDLDLVPVTLDATHWQLRQYLANWPSVHTGMSVDAVADLLNAPLGSAESLSEDTRDIQKGSSFHGIDMHGRHFEENSDGTYSLRSNAGDELLGTGRGTFTYKSGLFGYRLTFNDGTLTGKTDGQGAVFDWNIPSSTRSVTQLGTFPGCAAAQTD